jgi:hypothetical protein
VEHRRQPVAPRRTRSLEKKGVAKNNAATPASLPNIAELIANGEITIGVLSPVGCVAIATDGHNTLAMLKRRRGETLAQLLARLDQATTKRSPKTSSPTKSTHRPAIPKLVSVHFIPSWTLQMPHTPLSIRPSPAFNYPQVWPH